MHRLRWDNIARAAAILAVVALVMAWPHLKGAPPSLPPAAATPVSIEDPPPVPARAPRAKEPRPRRAPRPPKHPRARHHIDRHPAPAPPPVPLPQPAAPQPAVPAPPPPPPAPAPSASDLAAHEFAVP